MEKNYTQHPSNIYNTIPQMMAQEISSSDANNKVLATAAIYDFDSSIVFGAGVCLTRYTCTFQFTVPLRAATRPIEIMLH